jgi:exodeoxyribonuclease III
LVAVYVPNAGECLKRLDYRVKEWDKAFFEYLNKLNENKNIIVCGDLNVAHKEIDIFDPKNKKKSAGFTNEERESFTKFLEYGYVDTFRHFYPEIVKYSYFSMRAGRKNIEENKGWRLDYFITNKDHVGRIVDSQILNEYEGSDHCPIKLIVKS